MRVPDERLNFLGDAYQTSNEREEGLTFEQYVHLAESDWAYTPKEESA